MTDEKVETLSAYERAALEGNDPRCVPIELEEPPPIADEITYPDYSAEEHEIWALLYERQQQFLPGRACDEYLEGLRLMDFSPDRIPDLREVSKVLQKATNWQCARIPGLLHSPDFFGLLSRRVFPSTDYIRTREELDYTPAPDLFHDMFGHTPMITLPAFADFYQRIGQASLRAEGEDVRRMERFYWFTVEFGLINTSEGRRIYGNGILSSYEEVQHSLTDAVETKPFDPEVIAETDYDVWHLQPLLFVIDSFDQLAAGFDDFAKRRGLLD